MLGAELSIVEHGAQFLPALAAPMLPHLERLASRLPNDIAGARLTDDEGLRRLLDASSAVGDAASRLAGEKLSPVRAVMFEKSDRVNWALGWHQDRTIAVRERKEASGFNTWTVKQGIQHVEPPFEVIERMITLRVHIDPVDEDNAPLLIALGSHSLGRIAANKVGEAVRQSEVFACLAQPGDVWAYSTPIVHSSKAAERPGRRRRVLQVDYAGGSLPEGLEWLGV
jgi:hypothetical protein